MKLVLTICAVIAAYTPIHCLANDSKSNIDKSATMKVEELITIKGERPLKYFREQVVIEEMKFYDIYNALVSDEDFRIKCRNVRQYGTVSIVKKVCQPVYKKRKPSEQNKVRYSHVGGIQLSSNLGVRYENRVKSAKKRSMEEMSQMLEKNPKLRNQLEKFIKAKELLDTKRDEKLSQ